jgi:geranylgeranyl diphosphate synthase, type I
MMIPRPPIGSRNNTALDMRSTVAGDGAGNRIGSNVIDPAWRDVERELIEQALERLLDDQPYLSALRALLDDWLQPRGEIAELIDYLPGLVAVACGASESQAVRASVAWRLLRLAAKLIDDVQDGDVGAEAPQVLGYSMALTILSHSFIVDLEQAGLSPRRTLLATGEWERACLHALAGQHEDLTNAEIDADAWLRIAEHKSGALLSWAAWLGGLVAGIDERRCAALSAYGAAVGLILQVADDYNDIWPGSASPGHKRTDEWSLHSNLAIAYTRALPSTAVDRGDLVEQMCRSSTDGDPASQRERDARIADMLDMLGARTFMRSVGHVAYSKGMIALSKAFAPAAAPPELVGLFSRIWPALATSGSTQAVAP